MSEIPTASPVQNDGIYTIHVNLPSCYLKPAGSVEPQLPDGTFSFDAQEGHWKPSPNNPKRQEFRIQCKNEIVFIAGAQYTYRPNTSLHVKCKKATFMPHPTDSSQKTVTVRMPGTDAEHNLLAKGEEGKSGKAASIQIPSAGGISPWVISHEAIYSATEGGAGADGTTGAQGADAGSLTIEADSYDTSALTDANVFFIADCTGGKGQQGGDGGDGGSGGNGLNDTELLQAQETSSSAMGKWPTSGGHLGIASGGIKKRSVDEELIVKGFLGAKGGTAGRQGAGGYGGSGGQLIVNLPKESARDDKLKTIFGVQSNAGTPGTPGAAGKPGSGGRCGDAWLLKNVMLPTPKDNLDSKLRSELKFDWSSDVVNKWAAWLVNRTEPSPVSGDAAIALDEQEIQNRRVRAGQHTPATTPNVVFKETNKL
ncbi:hypothetical protein FPRO05_09111 [Fusarium proliferatum]|uniref:Uncharacterized protein n=1 Tax=Gibberella intermedia TaxID=948311 RepID=A0A365NG81_GIBIN|nr:hypothetical protein FPRO05_09111 [Fusarium proliferatum]